jgi:two-component sensor histidine kinase
MAILHEKLYRSKDLARIDFREYVVDLAGNLLTLNTDKASRIEMKVDIEGVILDINNSIPCGLIINELASNALAHAFPDGRKGRIDISMRSGSGGRIGLTVRDNGTGFPEDIDFRNTASLGMQLVTSLVKQLGGLIEMDRTEGTSFSIEFQA